MPGYQNPQGSTVVVHREGSVLHVSVSRSIDDPPISESGWSAQLAAAAKRELGRTARRLTIAATAAHESTDARRQRRSAVYLIDSAFTLTDRGTELGIAVCGPLAPDGAHALTTRLPADYVVRYDRGAWWITHHGAFLHKLSIGAKVAVPLPPRCELAEHFGQGVTATTRITVRGSMVPFLTVAHACTQHTPTPEQLIAHNAIHGETVDSIEIIDLSSGRPLVSWTPQMAADQS